MEIDFNLDNYDLTDLLNLFNLNHNFNISDLKNAKKIVMQTHPDKCGLSKEYFLFYCKAFRIIKNIYDFKNNRNNTLDNNKSKITYLAESQEDLGKKFVVDNLLKKDKQYFHEWFNKTFESINIVEEERKTGYGNWFSSSDDCDSVATNLSDMHKMIHEKKEALSTLVKKENIQEAVLSTSSMQELGGSVPDSYSSNIFSKLPYEDLKKAHTETVVPVCQNDYDKILKFNNLEVLRKYRNSQNVKPLSQEETKNYMDNKTNSDNEYNIQLAYKLAKQEEIAEEANKTWWSNLRQLK